tara:strand:- start:1881 stop:2165 length:285 start_codon:yes stop_codon:yes gene_type:complete
MPKPQPVKKVVPIRVLESTPFTEVIEIERTVTPDEEKRVDHIFVRRKKINKMNPSEIFETEETARFDIAWPQEPKEELSEEVSEDQMLKAIRSK